MKQINPMLQPAVTELIPVHGSVEIALRTIDSIRATTIELGDYATTDTVALMLKVAGVLSEDAASKAAKFLLTQATTAG